MSVIIEGKNIHKLIFFNILLISLTKGIICNINSCFEYSCEECNSSEYGKCTKCRNGWELIDGTCPCFNSSCALCITGLGGLNICQVCKKGFVWDDFYCNCNISNCEQCGEDKCLVCKVGYYYNNATNKCEKPKEENMISCLDPNCDICFSEYEGACVKCKEGYNEIKGSCNPLEKADNRGRCPKNYYKIDNYCFPICRGIDCYVKSYNSYSLCPSNKCLLCNNNHLDSWTECDNSVECSLNKGCMNCISNDECLYCNQGYYLLGGICHKCIEGCSICYDNNSCEYCLSGFELTLDKKCNLTYNFDFDIELYNRQKEILLNKTCSDNNCLSCTYRDEKEECQKCSIGYGPYRERCRECSSNCLDCFYLSGLQYCRECENGYMINSGGKCSLICSDENCSECYLEKGKEYCKSCKNNYKVNEEKCSPCSNWEGCNDCYYSNGKEYCKECINGYYLKDGNCTKCSDEKCQSCYYSEGKEYCKSCYNDRYTPYEEKCIKCSDEKCLSCEIKNGKELCTKCESGYEINEGNCSVCSENCSYCSFSEGKEKCYKCKEGFGQNKEGKCFDCKPLDEKCKLCAFEYYSNGVCFNCEKGYKLSKRGKCSLICSIENCSECSIDKKGEVCNKCKDSYKTEKDKCIKCEDKSCLYCDEDEKICTQCNPYTKLFDGKCATKYNCHERNLEYCDYCFESGACAKCYSGYEVDKYGYCKKKKNLKKIIIPIIISIFILILILIIVVCYFKKRKNDRINELRINQRNNNYNNNANIYIRNYHSQGISTSDNNLFEKDLSDEFIRQKTKFKENKLCQICNKNIGKYIGDCGCIVCQEHSKFKEIKKDEENYKICFNCGKTVKNLSLIKNNCHICLQEVPSVCHFKCGCTIEVCETCYIKCKRMSKKCPGCRGNI